MAQSQTGWGRRRSWTGNRTAKQEIAGEKTPDFGRRERRYEIRRYFNAAGSFRRSGGDS
jgi:hypothetical protein